MPIIRGRIPRGAVAVLLEEGPRVVETLGELTVAEHVALRVGHRSEAPATLPLATTSGSLTVERAADGSIRWSADVDDATAAAVQRGDLAVSPKVQPASFARRVVGGRVSQVLSGPITEIALMEPAAAAYRDVLKVEVVPDATPVAA